VGAVLGKTLLPSSWATSAITMSTPHGPRGGGGFEAFMTASMTLIDIVCSPRAASIQPPGKEWSDRRLPTTAAPEIDDASQVYISVRKANRGRPESESTGRISEKRS
jgi:hypothetical protein